MNPLTEPQIRASFVNASRREVTQATLPDLAELDWDRLDYLGWTDRKYPLRSYVVVPVDGEPVGLMLRASDSPRRPSAMCAWCEDVTATADVALLVARRSGAAGRNGDSVGTLLHTDFSCSRHVRRTPTKVEAGDDPAGYTAARVEGLRQRAARFVSGVRDGA